MLLSPRSLQLSASDFGERVPALIKYVSSKLAGEGSAVQACICILQIFQGQTTVGVLGERQVAPTDDCEQPLCHLVSDHIVLNTDVIFWLDDNNIII